MVNVNAAAVDIYPQAGADSQGRKVGFVDSIAKASQNDTVTITNASSVQVLSIIDDTTGAFETHTVATNVVTMTSATTGAKTLMVLYK